MNHIPSHTYSPIDVEELLTIGGNSSFAEGVLVFDNLDNYTDDILSQKLFIKMLVKPKLDILVMCISGELNYMLDSSKPVSLQPGTIAFFRQDQIVELNEKGATAKIIMIAFAHEMTIGIRGMDNIGVSYDTAIYIPSRKSLEMLKEIYRLLRNAIAEVGNTFRKEIIQSYARIIMMYLSDIVGDARKNSLFKTGGYNPRRETMIYNEFTRLVKDNYKEHRDVGHYAERMCISPEHLSRIVKVVSGKSASEWIRDYVVLEAKVLLKSSDMSVYQISDTLNFPNPSFFTKFFRKSTGMTPGTFRNGGE